MTKDMTGNTVPHAAASTKLPTRAVGLGGLIFLIALADFLFWSFRPSATLGIFALGVFAVAALQNATTKNLAKPALLMALAVLPIFEHAQLLSVAILLIGTTCSLAWLRIADKGGLDWVVATAVKLIAAIPFAGMAAALTSLRNMRGHWMQSRTSRQGRSAIFLRNWSLPVGGSLILGSLLLSANPVLEQVVVQLFQFEMNVASLLKRALFWTGVGLLIWPLLNAPVAKAPASLPLPAFGRSFGLNGGSVLRALIVFNLFLGIQTTLDFSILFGHAALPDGMTYATYAHRGAYPLMVTAMLAGVFSITARPFLNDHTALKPLLILWVMQNVVLTFTAAMRLNLYVAEYGLTYLRTYALVGMALIAVGLVVILWHVIRQRRSMVLVLRLAALGFATLYLCSFVNFAGIIASNLITRASDPSHVTSVDWGYLCRLGPTASKSVARGLAAHPTINPPSNLQYCFQRQNMPTNWRAFDLRILRTQVAF